MSARIQLERLRKAMEIGLRDEDISDLRDIEKRIKNLEDYATLAKRPGISQLLDWCKGDIRGINDRLSTDVVLMKDGHEGERFAILNRKEILLYFVGLFDPYAELDLLEKELSDRAQQFDEYHNN